MDPEPRPKTVDFGPRICVRYANYDTPLWARGNTGPSRWNHAGYGPTQYLCLSTDSMWAELIRTEELDSEDEVSMVRMPFWELRVHVGMIADYSTFELADEAGFIAQALVDDDHTICRNEGLRLRKAGFQGVLSPSAALPGEVNLTLFGARRAVAWDEPVELASAVPVRRIAVASPPSGLIDRVRKRGEDHQGLQVYLRGRS